MPRLLAHSPGGANLYWANVRVFSTIRAACAGSSSGSALLHEIQSPIGHYFRNAVARR
jgi:hypothetical protein